MVFKKISQYIPGLQAQESTSTSSSEQLSVRAEAAIEKDYVANLQNPFLVSFPRTGSHWLRMLCELYFERPTLVRMFYYPEKTNYLFLHRHDVELDVERENVIYLYREPVMTIYSQLNYHDENPDDADRIRYWAEVYGQHLNKWLIDETFTKKKTILTYEAMRQDLPSVIQKVAVHLGEPFDAQRLEQVAAQVTKEEVKRKTEQHDGHVVQLDRKYQQTGEVFKERHADLVWQTVLKNRAALQAYF